MSKAGASTDAMRATDSSYCTELLHRRRSGYRFRPELKSTSTEMLRMKAHRPWAASCSEKGVRLSLVHPLFRTKVD